MLSFTSLVSGESVAEELLRDNDELALCLGLLSTNIKAGSTAEKELRESLDDQFSYGELENIQKFAYVLARNAEELMSEKAK